MRQHQCAIRAGELRAQQVKTEARALAADRLDAVGALNPDQRLLRVLLDDHRPAFEPARTERLLEHHAGVGPDPAPRTPLPVRTDAVATLASLAHGCHLGIQSAWLPDSLLRTPQR